MGLWLLRRRSAPGARRRPAPTCLLLRAAAAQVHRARRSSTPTTRRSCRPATCRPGSPRVRGAAGSRAGDPAAEIVRCILDSLALAYRRRSTRRRAVRPGRRRGARRRRRQPERAALPAHRRRLRAAGAGRPGRGHRARQRAGAGAGRRASSATEAGWAQRRSLPRSSPGRPAVAYAGLMKIALFVTCLADALFARGGQATVFFVRLLERLAPKGSSPRTRTCSARCTSTPATSARPRCRWCAPRRGLRGVRRDRRAVRVVRRLGAAPARDGGRAGRDAGLARRGGAVAARTYELSELLVDVLGVTDVGAYFPHRVTYHPTCHSLRMLRVGDQPLQLLRAVAGSTWSSCPAPTSAAASAARSRSRTPTRRRRCWPTRCGTCSRPAPRSAPPATRPA